MSRTRLDRRRLRKTRRSEGFGGGGGSDGRRNDGGGDRCYGRSGEGWFGRWERRGWTTGGDDGLRLRSSSSDGGRKGGWKESSRRRWRGSLSFGGYGKWDRNWERRFCWSCEDEMLERRRREEGGREKVSFDFESGAISS